MNRKTHSRIVPFRFLAPLLALAAAACAGDPADQWPPASLANAPAENCFGAEARADPAVDSILHLTIAPAEGTVVARGTGFIVRGSAGPDGLARIVTAAHVIAPVIEQPGRLRVHVTLADGRLMGEAQLLATAVPWDPRQRHDASLRDLAVLALVPAGPAVAAQWRGMAGLPLAPVQRADSVLRGRFADPAGPDFGASGSPILDETGRVRGVLTKLQGREAVAATLMTGGGRLQPHGVWTGQALPRASLAIGDPLSAAPVLAALNMAGQGVRTQVAEDRHAAAPMTLAGFPQMLCVRFRGEMAEAPLPPDAARAEMIRRALAGLPVT